jgi:hypothetical protein
MTRYLVPHEWGAILEATCYVEADSEEETDG